ncbi:DUF1810 domain-containing protein [Nakamurella endophytica]|uniref:Calpastatin n=1 Tax=Nakamurella endophytica TaxID=1748367 RepID=A0A917SMJ5_9ACTN|nr:DUF1810 domain-containing protein [Nakamurella endophytica]GGL89976.1 calpastatin [Nakamurella endophytica]
MPEDPFDLPRFVDAQDAGGTYRQALAELERGRKSSHWMWFVFPQLAGLGQSAMSRRYAIASLDEARAYLAHPVLGARLRECLAVLARTEGRSAVDVFGSIDAQKLQSSVTLFLRAAPDEEDLQRVLDRYFGGRPDQGTDRLLDRA